MNNKKREEIKSLISKLIIELVAKMGLTVQVKVSDDQQDQDNEKIICNIESKESNFLIGQYGTNLQALQHIARLLIRKKISERINFILDVNSYRQEKDSSLITLANHMAQQAINENKEVTLRPMSPYERRLVHLELANNKQIQTESMGEKENRRIVIRPIKVA